MTDGQVKFQTLQENRRHNLEMERYTGEENKIAKQNADTKVREVSVAEAKLPYDIRQSEARTQLYNVQSASTTVNTGKSILEDLFYEPIQRMKDRLINVGKLFF